MFTLGLIHCVDANVKAVGQSAVALPRRPRSRYGLIRPNAEQRRAETHLHICLWELSNTGTQLSYADSSNFVANTYNITIHSQDLI